MVCLPHIADSPPPRPQGPGSYTDPAGSRYTQVRSTHPASRRPHKRRISVRRAADQWQGHLQVPKKGCREGGRQYPLEPSPARVSAGNTASPFPETETGPWLCLLVSPTAASDHALLIARRRVASECGLGVKELSPGSEVHQLWWRRCPLVVRVVSRRGQQLTSACDQLATVRAAGLRRLCPCARAASDCPPAGPIPRDLPRDLPA